MRTYKKMKSMFKSEPYVNLKDGNLRKPMAIIKDQCSQGFCLAIFATTLKSQK